MRTTETMTISLPPAMAKQMEKVQREEHRTRSELLREAWRHYFESRYALHTPTKAERSAIAKKAAAARNASLSAAERRRIAKLAVAARERKRKLSGKED